MKLKLIFLLLSNVLMASIVPKTANQIQAILGKATYRTKFSAKEIEAIINLIEKNGKSIDELYIQYQADSNNNSLLSFFEYMYDFVKEVYISFKIDEKYKDTEYFIVLCVHASANTIEILKTMSASQVKAYCQQAKIYHTVKLLTSESLDNLFANAKIGATASYAEAGGCRFYVIDNTEKLIKNFFYIRNLKYNEFSHNLHTLRQTY